MVIRRIGPLSAGKVAGVLYAGFGLIFGAIFSLVTMLGGIAGQDAEGAAFGALFGVAAVVVMPIMYGVLGFLTAVIGAWLYNIAASVTGGIELSAVAVTPEAVTGP